MKVAVLGTGLMGGPMARNLAQASHEVRAWNRTRAKAELLADSGVEVADSPAKAVASEEAVVTMLADASAVEAAMGDGGALEALPDGSLWIQMGTVGVPATERFAALAAERGVVFVDAPVLGTRQPAEEGKLVVLASGPSSAQERAAPIFDAVARKTVWLGEAGAGTRLKLVVNAWILNTIENLAETIALSEGLGLDPNRFLEAIEGGAMDMPYAHIKGKSILERDFPPSFPLRLALKDLRLILEAVEGELELPVVEATTAQFERAVDLGHGDEDMAAAYYASATQEAAGRR